MTLRSDDPQAFAERYVATGKQRREERRADAQLRRVGSGEGQRGVDVEVDNAVDPDDAESDDADNDDDDDDVDANTFEVVAVEAAGGSIE